MIDLGNGQIFLLLSLILSSLLFFLWFSVSALFNVNLNTVRDEVFYLKDFNLCLDRLVLYNLRFGGSTGRSYYSLDEVEMFVNGLVDEGFPLESFSCNGLFSFIVNESISYACCDLVFDFKMSHVSLLRRFSYNFTVAVDSVNFNGSAIVMDLLLFQDGAPSRASISEIYLLVDDDWRFADGWSQSYSGDHLLISLSFDATPSEILLRCVNSDDVMIDVKSSLG